MRDTELERHIGILSVITVRHGQRKTADDCTSEWEIETLPSVTRAEVHDYCRTHLSSDDIPYEQWSQQGCTAYALGYYNSYQKDIWTADGTGRTPYRRNCRESESKGSYQQQMVADTSRLVRTYTNTRTSRPTIQNPEAMDARQSKLGYTCREPTTECGTKRVFSKLIA